jgi:uncharacterized glyoxalase superfamily protein PhnB
MITSVNVYLYFPGNTEEAFTAYRTIFGGDFSAVVRFRDFPDNPMRIPGRTCAAGWGLMRRPGPRTSSL